MNAVEARDAILAVFATAWAGTGLLAVYDDVPNNKPDQGYAAVYLRHADGGQASLANASGARLYDAAGTVWVQIFAPGRVGSRPALALAGTVLNAYRSARNPGVWFQRQRLVEMGRDGAYYRVDVLAEFNYSASV